jgi:hypothetical protein
MMCISRVKMIILTRVLIRVFNVTDDRNVPVGMMNATVTVSLPSHEDPHRTAHFLAPPSDNTQPLYYVLAALAFIILFCILPAGQFLKAVVEHLSSSSSPSSSSCLLWSSREWPFSTYSLHEER